MQYKELQQRRTIEWLKSSLAKILKSMVEGKSHLILKNSDLVNGDEYGQT